MGEDHTDMKALADPGNGRQVRDLHCQDSSHDLSVAAAVADPNWSGERHRDVTNGDVTSQ